MQTASFVLTGVDDVRATHIFILAITSFERAVLKVFRRAAVGSTSFRRRSYVRGYSVGDGAVVAFYWRHVRHGRLYDRSVGILYTSKQRRDFVDNRVPWWGRHIIRNDFGRGAVRGYTIGRGECRKRSVSFSESPG